MARQEPEQRADTTRANDTQELSSRNLRKRAAKQSLDESVPIEVPQSDPQFPETSAKRRRLSDEDDKPHPVEYWLEQGSWPPPETPDKMKRMLARKRSVSTLRGCKRSESGSSSYATPSDQRPREEKSAQYREARYEQLLLARGVFMDSCDASITDESKEAIEVLKKSKQVPPQGTLFDENCFVDACRNLRGRNEAKVIQDVSRLLVPSAEALSHSNADLRHLVESVNEGWNNAIALAGTRPQPDYAVGFRRAAFSDARLEKMAPILGDIALGDQSLFMATWYMYFPFLTCEVKCGGGGIEVADRQNAHSTALAVRATAELFRLVGRQEEVHRQVLAFSVSHNDTQFQIFGHYPHFTDNGIKYYRHLIYIGGTLANDGKDRWMSYRIVKNIYETWMPGHLQRLLSAIDQLPASPDFEVAPLEEVQVGTPEASNADSAEKMRPTGI